MKKLFFAIIIYMAYCLGINAQDVPDVDSLGHIWIVTVDNSKSMQSDLYHREVSKSELNRNVTRRLNAGGYLDEVDYERDRFIFYTSGLFKSTDDFGNKIAQLRPLDFSLIHHTDSLLHSFSDKNQLISYISGIISSNDYGDIVSFTSQIKTFSVVKTVNYLKYRALSDDFNGLRLITITDDADQNDDWDKDYKHIRQGDKIARKNGRKPVSESTRDTIVKYVHSDFRAAGKGVFKELYSGNDETLPHIWVYEYETLQSRRDTIYSPLKMVTARDGRKVSFSARQTYIQGDSVCFYTIDSVCVNGTSLSCSERFMGRDSIAIAYNDGLGLNDVKLHGSVQMKYHDDIYGEHYRKLYFVHEQKVPSGILYLIIMILLIVVCLVVVTYLVYRFIWLPRSELFRIYDPSSHYVIVRRGYEFQWKNEFIPVAHYETDFTDIVSVLVRKDRKVFGKSSKISSAGSALLICSRKRLFLSEQALEHNSNQDISDIYYLRSGVYPRLLRDVYEASFVARLRKINDRLSVPLLRNLMGGFIKVVNLISPRYYYYFEDVISYESICIESFILSGKKFLIGVQEENASCPSTVEEKIISKAVNHYYSSDSVRPCDALLCYDVIEGKQYWSIVLLDNPTSMSPELNNVHVAYRYICDKAEMYAMADMKRLASYARRYLRGKVIEFVDCRPLLSSGTFNFKMSSVLLPGFVSVLESVARPSAQLLYSPFADGMVAQKYVSFSSGMQDGELYISFLPYRNLRRRYTKECRYMMKKLSSNIIRTNDNTSGYVMLKYNELSFRDIKIKFDN